MQSLLLPHIPGCDLTSNHFPFFFLLYNRKDHKILPNRIYWAAYFKDCFLYFLLNHESSSSSYYFAAFLSTVISYSPSFALTFAFGFIFTFLLETSAAITNRADCFAKAVQTQAGITVTNTNNARKEAICFFIAEVTSDEVLSSFSQEQILCFIV